VVGEGLKVAVLVGEEAIVDRQRHRANDHQGHQRKDRHHLSALAIGRPQPAQPHWQNAFCLAVGRCCW